MVTYNVSKALQNITGYPNALLAQNRLTLDFNLMDEVNYGHTLGSNSLNMTGK